MSPVGTEQTGEKDRAGRPRKVHVATTFDRFTKDKKLIATETSLYILEKIDGRWGIRGRSSLREMKAATMSAYGTFRTSGNSRFPVAIGGQADVSRIGPNRRH